MKGHCISTTSMSGVID